MKIVFIHGRSQQRKMPEQLKSDWTQAMLSGFQAIGSPYLQVPDVAFPYYGDQLFDDTDKLTQKEFQDLVDKGADAAAPGGEEEQFIRDLVYGMAAQQGISQEQIAQAANSDLTDKGLLNWRSVLAALRLLDQIPGISSTTIELITRDVWCYLTNVGARHAVNDIVAPAIPSDEPCVVIAHSLGSIVAYNVLMNRATRGNVRLLVTVGSPLGIEAVFKRLPSDTKPRKAPTEVPQWFNARDDRDVVALFEIPSAKYGGAPIVENYSGVENTSENRHGIVEYLKNPRVAKAIREVLG